MYRRWFLRDSWHAKRTWNGVIDEVSIYSSGLSTSEIRSLFEAASSVRFVAPVSYAMSNGEGWATHGGNSRGRQEMFESREFSYAGWNVLSADSEGETDAVEADER